MTNAKPLIRDRERLTQLDEDISDTLFDLGQAAAFIANVEDYKQRLMSIFATYAKKSDAFISVSGEPTTQAATYIAALWDLNQAYKRFIAVGNTDGFDAFNRKYKDSLGITLTRVNYEKLPSEYDCARGFNKCDKTYQNFGKNVSSVFNNAKEDSKEAITTITNAVTRLKCAFAKQSSVNCPQPGFKDKQNDLLRGLYGIA